MPQVSPVTCLTGKQAEDRSSPGARLPSSSPGSALGLRSRGQPGQDVAYLSAPRPDIRSECSAARDEWESSGG